MMFAHPLFKSLDKAISDLRPLATIHLLVLIFSFFLVLLASRVFLHLYTFGTYNNVFDRNYRMTSTGLALTIVFCLQTMWVIAVCLLTARTVQLESIIRWYA